jgi:hypothetical protein
MVPQPEERDGDIDADLEEVNARLAEWAARSATTSDALVDRFEEMGYAVRGKSEDDIAEVLRHPPTGPRRGSPAG